MNIVSLGVNMQQSRLSFQKLIIVNTLPAIFNVGFSFDDSNKFCGLRSMCAISLLCRNFKANARYK